MCTCQTIKAGKKYQNKKIIFLEQKNGVLLLYELGYKARYKIINEDKFY